MEVPNGNEVIPIANAMMKRFEMVVATQDWHPAGHGSFASTHHKTPYEIIELHGLNQVLLLIIAYKEHMVQSFILTF